MKENMDQWATGAEMTAAMIVWPKRCGHGGLVLELVEHFRPYWLTRRAGASASARVRKPGMALSAGLGLAAAPPQGDEAAITGVPLGHTGMFISIRRWRAGM